MHGPSIKAHLLAVVVMLASFASASSTLDTRASSLTLPDIFKNATTQVTAIQQQINRAIVFNKTVSDPALVRSLLTKISAVIDSTAAQVNKTGKLPYDQISGGLSQDEIGYISTDFLNAVTISLVAPQSVVASFPEIQKGIDAVTASICPRNWLCVWFPWLCWIWWPWILLAQASFQTIAKAITP